MFRVSAITTKLFVNVKVESTKTWGRLLTCAIASLRPSFWASNSSSGDIYPVNLEPATTASVRRPPGAQKRPTANKTLRIIAKCNWTMIPAFSVTTILICEQMRHNRELKAKIKERLVLCRHIFHRSNQTGFKYPSAATFLGVHGTLVNFLSCGYIKGD